MMIINPKKVYELKKRTAKVCDDPTGKAIVYELIDYICHLQNQIVKQDVRIDELERKLEEVKDDRK